MFPTPAVTPAVAGARKRARERADFVVPEFPSDDRLAGVLTDLLRERGLVRGPVSIVDRSRSGRYSTYPNETVTCLADGAQVQVLCKYGKSDSSSGFGHRLGTRYETMVYRDVLTELGLSTPTFYGSHQTAGGDEEWLVMEYIAGHMTLEKGPHPASILRAASWVGRFHAKADAWMRTADVSPFIRYDRDYYAGWPRRMRALSEPLHGLHPWIPDLCRGAEAFVDRFLEIPQTLIHGECTVHNFVIRGAIPDHVWKDPAYDVQMALIDWESAAIAFGEIDIAVLVDQWPADVEAMCYEEYTRGRWGDNPPADADFNIRAGQLYMHLRWLGNSADTTTSTKNSFRLERLRQVGEELCLI
jgi:hypothetical protein